MIEELDREVIYDGIWIGDLDLSGKTRAEAEQLLLDQENEFLESYQLSITAGGSSWSIGAADAGVATNWRDLLAVAWQTGRTGESTDQEALIRERFAVLEQLKVEPLKLELDRTYSKEAIKKKIEAIALEANIEAQPARATDFHVDSKTFDFEERKAGRTLLVDDTLTLVLDQVDKQNLNAKIEAKFETTHVGMTAAEMGADLRFVSEGITYAKAKNDPRDNNIRLILKALNGMVMNPGESFSFNDYIGRRTKEKGYQMAGGIVGGILVETYGGGICQPNTTLYHAVLKADLQIDERHPHSWPSSYTEVGLDATVSWGGPDFKFTNNSDYPIAFVTSYKKPAIVVRLYGRPLADGASISLKAEITETIPVNPPKRTLVGTMAPGTVNVIREEHMGMRAVSYKVWSKNGSVFKTETITKSYYRPLSGIEEYGPELPPTEPTTEVTTVVTEATTAAETTAAETTAAETTAAETTAGETTAAETTAAP